MRFFSITTLIANLLLTGLAVIICPSSMASHFDKYGNPNGWMSSSGYAISMVIASLVLLLLFEGMARLVKIIPVAMVNVPNKAYWSRPENCLKMQQISAASIHGFGGLTLALIFTINLLAIKANLSNPVQMPPAAFYWVMGIFLLCMTTLIVKLFLDLRIPGNSDNNPESSPD